MQYFFFRLDKKSLNFFTHIIAIKSKIKLKMMTQKFEILKAKIQLIIDAIAMKNFDEANNVHHETSELLDEMIDHLDGDADLREISKYQVLLNQLFGKINSSVG